VIANDLTVLVSELNTNGVIVAEHGLGCLEVRGKDGLDLLHRLSTNDLLGGPVPRAVRTVFTSEKGRVVADAEVVVTATQIYLVARSSALGNLRDWIDRFTLDEDVRLDELTDFFTMTWLLGPLSFSSTSFRHQLESHFEATHSPNSPVGVWWKSDLGSIPGIRWLAGRNVAGGFLDAAEQGGRMKVDAASYDLIRIAAGVPTYPNELNGDVHPLEIGLREDISFNKGCYVGQEVVARLDAYDKVQRQLVLLAAQDYPAAGGQRVEVTLGDQILGQVTSVSSPLSNGGRLALAICRKGSHTEPDTELRLRAGAQTGSARVRQFLGPGFLHPERF
jgi:folate-binding protein YgfZ